MSFYRPMLTKTASKPFSDRDWVFEVKWDGFRALAYVKGEVSVKSRSGRELLFNFPELIELKQLARDVVLDGEIVILRGGRVDFEAMQMRSQVKSPFEVDRRMREAPATYVVFDVLEKDGVPLLDLPLMERKRILRESVRDGNHVVVLDFVEERGEAYFQATGEKGLEGVIAKRKDSRYEPGRRSGSWLKIKHLKTVDCVVFGYSRGEGYRAQTFGSLVVGLYGAGGKPVYVANVGTGFDRRLLDLLCRQMVDLKRADQTAPFPLEGYRGGSVTWVEPKLVCEVIFMSVTSDLKLRHPRFHRLRADKLPSECALDQIGNGAGV